MDFIGVIFEKIVENGVLDNFSLLIILIALVIIGYMKVLAPMKEKLDKIPEITDIEKMQKSVREIENLRITELKDKLEDINNTIGKIEFIDFGVSKDITDLKSDVEHMKQVLNQLQGHIMYSDHHKTSIFGNKELK